MDQLIYKWISFIHMKESDSVHDDVVKHLFYLFNNLYSVCETVQLFNNISNNQLV